MAEDYDMLTQIEHVLQRSDMYIGDIQNTTEARWIPKKNKMVRKIIKYNPGLEQCVMELITNATDRAQDPKNGVTKIEVDIEDDTVKVKNDGKGIPIEIHPKHGIYIPEMIFGNMLSSSNYKKDVKRTVGGKNGIGAKAANIFSKKFTITTQCDGRKYTQTFTNNMQEKTKPKITNTKSKDYTLIEFTPDYSKFGMKKMDNTKLLIQKRTIDASAVTGKNVKVSFCGEKIDVKNFEDYMKLYIGDESKVYSDLSDRWSVGIAITPFDRMEQISFVNGICTEEGGTHVSSIIDPILNRITKDLQDKNPELNIRKQFIKDNIIVFVKCLIENPTFNSQTKRFHTTRPQNFGSRPNITETFIKKINKLGITKGVVDIARAKDLKNLKKTDGKKKVRITDIPKLDDANKAGTHLSKQCTIILTEGDSAKATALAGLSVVGKDYWGVFPLKGKLLNVRDCSPKKIMENEEITNINKILGLSHGEENIEKLRYGRIMIMADQDLDGMHIKGLVINYISYFWPNLLEKSNFICSLLTPIIKVFKGSNVKNFYNVEDYNSWKTDKKGWRVKYYKGLGTSTSKEAKEYFQNIEQNTIHYTQYQDGGDSIELAFKKTNADKRKIWIKNTLLRISEYGKVNKPLIDYNIKDVPIKSFINNELSMFSIYDTHRSIPHVLDGLKPSQRKILYSCIKRNLFVKSDGSGEIKVAQLSGYVSEHSGYHHGEMSLQGAIVGMAQDYTGSNNMNLLAPKGQFGTRIKGGKDASSPRYIYTYLNDWVKDVFNEWDNKLLNYLNDDGFSIEPEYYVPTIPLLLVNGSEGIGTGWSTNISCFNPKDIVENIKLLLEDENNELKELVPWYRGFSGTITKTAKNCWETTGSYETVSNNIVRVTELPVGYWTDDFKLHLLKLEQNGDIKSFENNSTDKLVNFTINVGNFSGDIVKLLKLKKNIKCTNMHAFDQYGLIKKYDCPEEILWEFFVYRKKFYSDRKKLMLDELGQHLEAVSEKMRFIKMVIDGQILVFRKKKNQVLEQLVNHNFTQHEQLLNIKIHAFTEEKLETLQREIDSCKNRIGEIQQKSIENLWEEDLGQIAYK